MSNALVSKQLTAPTMPETQMVQLDAIVSRTDSLVPNILEGSTSASNGNPARQLFGNPAIPQQTLSSMEDHFMSSYPMFIPPMQTESLISYNLNGQLESMLSSVNVRQYNAPSLEVGHRPGVQSNSGQPRLSVPNKRKLAAEPCRVHQNLTKMSAPNKRVAQMGSYAKAPIVVHESALNKKAAKTSAKSSASGKLVYVEAAAKKSGQPQVSLKGQMESFDSVRTKLRDSLASALALVVQEREIPSDGKMKTEDEAVKMTQEGESGNKPLVSASNTVAATLEPMNNEGCHASRTPLPTDGISGDKESSSAALPKEVSGEALPTEGFLRSDYPSKTILPGEETIFSNGFYFKDEFLRGNGLSWVSDFNSHIPESKESENVRHIEPILEDCTSAEEEKKVLCPESLAFEIELELFKLFGGVNKKYKEKGRSLLFNLKDRNNPELRERVMSGEISPDCLCSMTAEELASKELSQWRIAKAEELDNMKVLPEEVNVRRFVKKTHKGEYQVDLDPDVGVLEDFSAFVSVPPPSGYNIHKSDGAAALKVEQTKVDQCEITLPSDGDDMQGLMVDDVKDLPPVISLDEFMESLNNEPPFENLPIDSAKIMAEPDQNNVEAKSRAHMDSPKQPAEVMSKEKLEVSVESPKTDAATRQTESPRGLKPNAAIRPTERPRGSKPNAAIRPTESPRGSKPDVAIGPTESPRGSKPNAAVQIRDCNSFWEGELQVNISSMVNFVALYKSGEKSCAREWPSCFEIKGRVKLDAFDKFLQALPMSRSRAVMVCHFALKEGYLDSERASLLELAESYIADERLGFAEPAPGVELYLCPPQTKSVDIIINRLSESYTDKLNDIDGGLIGIVVWRKVHITSSVASPISSQRKIITNKPSRVHYENDTNKNNVFISRPVSPRSLSKSQPADDEDDDLPPGFGPLGSRDDDDLPEFHFSDGSRPSATPVAKPNAVPAQEIGFHHHPAPSQQVEQMRELIQKYGQSGDDASKGIPIPIEPWKDDDDDIPEWQPQVPHHKLTPPLQQHVHNPVLHSHVTNHHTHTANHALFQHPQWPSAVQPLQPPMSVSQQRAWDPHANGGRVLHNRQFYGSPSGHVGRDRRNRNG